jgi:hypothetical protein
MHVIDQIAQICGSFGSYLHGETSISAQGAIAQFLG